MPQRARKEYVIESDEESSDGYTPIEVVEPRRRSRSRLAVRITDDHSPASRYERPGQVYHHQSFQQPYHPGYVAHPQVIPAPGLLGVPTHRPRASSTGVAPQPNFVPMYVAPPARDPSRERVKHHYHHRDHYSESSSEDEYGRHRRSRAKKRPEEKGEQLSAETIRKLAELEIRKQAELADRDGRRQSQYQDGRRRDEYSPHTIAKLAELDAMKRRKEREDEEAALMAKIEDRERREKEKRKQLLLQYEKEQEEAERAEQELADRVDAKRKKEEDRIKHERHQALLEERERIVKEKAEAKAERERIIAEEKVREEEDAAERRRIIAEEEDRRKQEKLKEDALRKRILAEEEERIAKEKRKEKAKEEEFQREVRERFMRAGYSPDYVDDILEQKQLVYAGDSRRTEENRLAIEMGRPTGIRVKEKDLLPETLDYYRLPWEYDPGDRKFILIKQYVSHQLQQELFKHTERIYRRRETRLITDGYTKDTVTTTTLKPKKDEMFMVRRKSEKQAKSPMGRNWMFT